MCGVVGQPIGEHGPFAQTTGEVRRHSVGMGQEPLVVRWLYDLRRLRRRAERDEELAPGEVDVRAVGEVDVGESCEAARLGAWCLEQRNQAEIAIGRTSCVSHDAFDLTPFTLDVVGRQDQQRLPAFVYTAFHLFDTRRATREVAKVDEGL